MHFSGPRISAKPWCQLGIDSFDVKKADPYFSVVGETHWLCKCWVIQLLFGWVIPSQKLSHMLTNLNTLEEELCHMTGSRKQHPGFREVALAPLLQDTEPKLWCISYVFLSQTYQRGFDATQ